MVTTITGRAVNEAAPVVNLEWSLIVSPFDRKCKSLLHPPQDWYVCEQMPVIGLTCVADAMRLERHLGNLLGVREATVNPVTDTAYITFDPLHITNDQLMAAITEAGLRAGY